MGLESTELPRVHSKLMKALRGLCIGEQSTITATRYDVCHRSVDFPVRLSNKRIEHDVTWRTSRHKPNADVPTARSDSRKQTTAADHVQPDEHQRVRGSERGISAPIRRRAVRRLIRELRLAYDVRLASRAYVYNALDAAGALAPRCTIFSIRISSVGGASDCKRLITCTELVLTNTIRTKNPACGAA